MHCTSLSETSDSCLFSLPRTPHTYPQGNSRRQLSRLALAAKASWRHITEHPRNHRSRARSVSTWRLTSHVNVRLPPRLPHLVAQLVRRIHVINPVAVAVALPGVLADYARAAGPHEAPRAAAVRARAARAALVLLLAAARGRAVLLPRRRRRPVSRRRRRASSSRVVVGVGARLVADAAVEGAAGRRGGGLDGLVRHGLGDHVLEELEVVQVRDGAGQVLVLDVAARLLVRARDGEGLLGELLDEHLLEWGLVTR